MEFFKTSLRLFGLLVLAGSLTLTSCSSDDDDDGGGSTLVEDGFYVIGDGSSFTELGENGLMADANNEVGQAPRAGMYETFVAVEGGTSIRIVEVAGSAQTEYGSNDLTLVDPMGENDQVNVEIWKGTYVAGGNPITIPDDGLYHVVIDQTLGAIAIIPVNQWGCIGAAFANGWAGDVVLASNGFDKQTMTFSATDVEIRKGQGKFRHSGGWKVEIDGDSVKVNTNFGGSLTALAPGGDNITFTEQGIYTVTMTWDATNGHFINLEKTGDVMATDYTDFELGIIGNAYFKMDGTQANWDENFGTHKPEVNGTIYTWTYDMIDFIENAEWKIREGDNWDGLSLGYGDVTWTGDAAGNFEDKGGNMLVTAGGMHKIILTIDGQTEDRTIEAIKL